MRRFWTRLAFTVFGMNAALLVAWITLGHQLYKPLPQLLYGHNRLQSLYLWDVDCPSLISICPHERMLLQGLNAHSVAQWSPDGAYIAVYLSESWAIYPADCLINNQSCTPWRLDPSANEIRIAWGPNGITLAYITNSTSGDMKILTRGCWDSSAGNCFEQTVKIVPKGVLRQPTWSANGGRFVFQGLKPQGLFLLEAECLDGPEQCIDRMQLVPVSKWPVYWPSLSADGKRLLYFAETVDGIEELYVADIDSGTTQQIAYREGGASVPVWSSDELYIAFAGFQSRSGGDLSIYLYDVDRQLTALAIHQDGADFNYPAWNPRP